MTCLSPGLIALMDAPSPEDVPEEGVTEDFEEDDMPPLFTQPPPLDMPGLYSRTVRRARLRLAYRAFPFCFDAL